jgi:hypothetical protein
MADVFCSRFVLTDCTRLLNSNLCGVGGVLDGLFALCGAGAWGYAGGVLQTAVDSNGNLRSEYESQGEVNTANEALQQALNELSANSSLPAGEELTNDYDAVLDQRRAAGIMTWIEFGYAFQSLHSFRSLHSIQIMLTGGGLRPLQSVLCTAVDDAVEVLSGKSQVAARISHC